MPPEIRQGEFPSDGGETQDENETDAGEGSAGIGPANAPEKDVGEGAGDRGGGVEIDLFAEYEGDFADQGISEGTASDAGDDANGDADDGGGGDA